MALTYHNVALNVGITSAGTRSGSFTLEIVTTNGVLVDALNDVVLIGRSGITAGTLALPAIPQDGIGPVGAAYRLTFVPTGAGDALSTDPFVLTADTSFRALLALVTSDLPITPALVLAAQDAADRAEAAAATASSGIAATVVSNGDGTGTVTFTLAPPVTGGTGPALTVVQTGSRITITGSSPAVTQTGGRIALTDASVTQTGGRILIAA